jgi:hypothetical protein
MLISPVELISEKGCAGDARQKLKSTDPTSRQRRRRTQQTRNYLKNNKQREWKKLVAGPRWVPDTKMDLTSDCCSRNITLT